VHLKKSDGIEPVGADAPARPSIAITEAAAACERRRLAEVGKPGRRLATAAVTMPVDSAAGAQAGFAANGTENHGHFFSAQCRWCT